ncbi:MAG TPA: thioredoxin domain-containing protein [Candidatus Saccharimonadales bacterium]|nr:thioredoxin domain-containing protein [Candidatus Saccharimonadales bacterium]
MSKQFWGVIAIIVLIFVGIFAFTGNGKDNGSKSNGNQPTNHVKGQGKDGVTLVEYGDYQCPFCGEYYPTLKQVETEFDSQITFQFRNYPLVNVHQNAYAGARAAEAAGLQNKFWQMHDLLYDQNTAYYSSNQTLQNWISASDPITYFTQYAQELGLNVSQFKLDYNSNKVNDLITADMQAGNKLNVQGTPAFFLDGKSVQVGNSVADFEKIIKAEINKKTKGSSSSTTPATSGTTEQTKK